VGQAVVLIGARPALAYHYLGMANNNLIYPAIAVNGDGQGVMAFTVVGADYFPSAGYVELDAGIGSSDICSLAGHRGRCVGSGRDRRLYTIGRVGDQTIGRSGRYRIDTIC